MLKPYHTSDSVHSDITKSRDDITPHMTHGLHGGGEKDFVTQPEVNSDFKVAFQPVKLGNAKGLGPPNLAILVSLREMNFQLL